MRILSEAVLEEKGEAVKKRLESHIKLKVSAHIPDTYITSAAQRMEMYKKITLINTKEDAMDVLDEFTDRFGDPPRVTARLVEVALAKAYAEKCGIPIVDFSGADIIFRTGKPNLALWSEVFAKFPSMRIAPGGESVIYRTKSGEPISEIVNILCTYSLAMDDSGRKDSGKEKYE